MPAPSGRSVTASASIARGTPVALMRLTPDFNVYFSARSTSTKPGAGPWKSAPAASCS